MAYMVNEFNKNRSINDTISLRKNDFPIQT